MELDELKLLLYSGEISKEEYMDSKNSLDILYYNNHKDRKKLEIRKYIIESTSTLLFIIFII